MLANLRADAARLRAGRPRPFPWYLIEALLFDNGFQAVVLYRIARWFKARRVPFFGPAFARLNLFLTGVDISPGADIGPGLLISHGVGLVIGGYTRVGAQALLLHNVTLGAPTQGRVQEMPTLGDGVFVGAGSSVLGDVGVGDGAVIGANVVVTRDVPAGAIAVSTARLEILEPGKRRGSPPPSSDPTAA